MSGCGHGGAARVRSELNQRVREYWESEPNGTAPSVAPLEGDRSSWFKAIEARRYELEPFIRAAAQFERYSGKRLLEIGVGVGTDHLQWARAGAICHGVDITDAAVALTKEHLGLHGFQSDLRVSDAETLPFPDESFDIVYSWGVIHHAESPARIVDEVFRVLRPGGVFVGMVYARHSVVALKLWIRHGLLKLRPLRSLRDVIWHHMESLGTKAYTRSEVESLFGRFRLVRLEQVATPYDRTRIPRFLAPLVPARFGWFMVIHATRDGDARGYEQFVRG